MILLEIKDDTTNRRSLAIIETTQQYIRDLRMRFTPDQFDIVAETTTIQIRGQWDDRTGEMELIKNMEPINVMEFMNIVEKRRKAEKAQAKEE